MSGDWQHDDGNINKIAEQIQRVDQWRKAVMAVVDTSKIVNKEFQKFSRLKNDDLF